MQPMPRVAVVVPVFNKVALTVRFLESFANVTYPNYTIIIVDDGSTDSTAQTTRDRFPHVVLLSGEGNLWWSGATNLGVKYALEHSFDYVLTINNDTRVNPDFLSRLVQIAQAHPRTLVGCRINFMEPPTKVWAAGGRMEWDTGIILQLLGYGMPEQDVLAIRPSPWPVPILTGCGTLVPIGCFTEAGLYDAHRFPQYHGDSEFVLRATAKGYQALVDLHAVVWNDARNTSKVKRGLKFFFSRRSPMYWRPILAIHTRYCPREFLFSCLWRQYPLRCYWMRCMAMFLLVKKLSRRKVKRTAQRFLGRSRKLGLEA
jgi:GT2 family glycosyltransferase